MRTPGHPDDAVPFRRDDTTPDSVAGLTSHGDLSNSEQTGNTAELPAAEIGDLDLPADADAAIAVLYHERWNSLVRLAALLTRDASVAEEIVQDAFVALHRRWHTLHDRRGARSYLRTSVVNGARSAVRHRQVVERHAEPAPVSPAGPEELALQATRDAEVLRALRQLSARQQEVLILRYYSDLSEKEIAQTLGISPGAVKSHAHRALSALRAALEVSAP